MFYFWNKTECFMCNAPASLLLNCWNEVWRGSEISLGFIYGWPLKIQLWSPSWLYMYECGWFNQKLISLHGQDSHAVMHQRDKLLILKTNCFQLFVACLCMRNKNINRHSFTLHHCTCFVFNLFQNSNWHHRLSFAYNSNSLLV